MKNNNVSDYEVGLLGLILVQDKYFHKIKGLLSSDSFSEPKNKMVYEAISDIYENGFSDIELRPIINKLKKNGDYDRIGGSAFLSHLMEHPALPSNINTYIKTINEKSDLRIVTKKINELNKQIQNNKFSSADEILQEVEQDIVEIIRGKKPSEFVDSKKGIRDAIKAIEDRASGKNLSGLPIGFPSVDKITGGFQKGDLIILAARPSMGKTALALNFAANASKACNVALFTLEMPTEQIFNRIISFTAYVSQNKLRDSKYLSKNEWNKIHASKNKIEKMKLYVDDTAGIPLSELIWKAETLHKNGKLDMIFIDYLQLITVPGLKSDNRQNEVSLISRKLKKLARDLNVPVIALSQLSRRVEQRESKVPMMSDLRESGAIEQDADIVSFLYRSAYYDKEDSESDNGKEISQIIIAKHRNGATGDIKIFFKPENGLFIERKD